MVTDDVVFGERRRRRAGRPSVPSVQARWLGVSLALITLTASCGDASNDRATTTLPQLLRPGHLVVLGELHGTHEFPAAIADAAGAVVADGQPLWVGLEIPRSEQSLLDMYLASDGDAAARNHLLTGRFWTFRDGRSSVGVLALIDRLRALRASGATVEVAAFDAADSALPAAERDRAMADFVAASLKPDRASLVLVGSLHAQRTSTSLEGEPKSVPMSQLLTERRLRLTSLRATHGGGEAWSCIDDECAPHRSRGRGRGPAQRIEVGDIDSDGYDGFLYVPKISAAAPAFQ